MTKTAQDCAVNLKGLLSTKDAEELFKEVRTVEEYNQIKDYMRREIALKTKARIDAATQQIHDKAIIERDIQTIVESSKSRSEVNAKMDNLLFGRNSLDTNARALKEELTANYYKMEAAFQVEDKFKLSKLEKGSKEANTVYKYVRSIEEQIDVHTLTPAKIKSLIGDNQDPLYRTALALASHNEFSRRALLRHGLPIKHRKDYVIKRRYDWNLMENFEYKGYQKGKKAWVRFMKDHLDPEETFGKGREDSVINAALFQIYDDFEANANKKTNTFTPSNRANSAERKSRKFVFKDADSDVEVFNRLSVGSLADQVESNAYGMSRLAVKIDRIGYSEAKWKAALDKAKAEKFGPASSKARMLETIGDIRRRNALASFTGENDYMASGWTTFGSAMKTMFAVQKLGNAITTAMLDPLDTMRQTYYVSGQMFGGFKEFNKNMANVMVRLNKEERLALAQDLGMTIQFMSTESAMRMSKGDLSAQSTIIGKGIEKYGAKAMSVATFLPQQTSISKLSSGVTGARLFGDILDGKGNKKFIEDTFKEYGFTNQELDFIRNNVDRIETWTGNKIITAQSIRDAVFKFDPEITAARLKMSPEEIGDFAFNLSRKYNNYLNDFFTRGTPTPELQAKSTLFKNTGVEVLDVTAGLVTQFMDTPIAQLQSFNELTAKLRRLEGADASWGELVIGMGGPLAVQLSGHLTMGAASYLAYDSIWSFATGKESLIEKYEKGDDSMRNQIMLDVAGRTSAVPFLFETINNATSNYYNNNVTGTVGGPFLDFVQDTANLVNPNSSETLGKFMKKQMPNAGAIQAIQNHLIGE